MQRPGRSDYSWNSGYARQQAIITKIYSPPTILRVTKRMLYRCLRPPYIWPSVLTEIEYLGARHMGRNLELLTIQIMFLPQPYRCNYHPILYIGTRTT